MKLLNLVQGTMEWKAHRATKFNASEAPAMMGDGYITRAELLRQKAGGEPEQVSDFQQTLFDRGHETEARQRALIEEDYGIELFPACGESEEHPRLAASYDGLDIDEETGFEHKLWNEELVAAMRKGDLPPKYYWQLEQQLLVNPKLKKVIFVCSDGTREKREILEYTAVRGRAKKLLAGWDQFEKDLAAHVPEKVQAPVVAKPVAALPALSYRLNGLALTSNIAEFRAAAELLIEKSKEPLETDQDFADRDELCKAFGEAEKRIDVMCGQVLGEIHDVAAFDRALRDMQAQFRAARLAGEKQVAAEKTNRRNAIKATGEKAVFDHMAILTARLAGRVPMPRITADFEGVMKGKKSLKSMKDSVDAEVARVKIESSEVADAIAANLKVLDELAPDHGFLFNDLQQIVGKAHDDFTLLVQSRVDSHKRAEEQRLQAERERIRQEEQQRAQEQQAAATAAATTQPSPAETTAETMQPARPSIGVDLANQPDRSVAHPSNSAPAPAASNVTSISSRRPPTDEEIIRALSLHFNVSESKVIARLRSMDFDAIEKRMAVPF